MFEVAELKCSKADQRSTSTCGDEREDEVNYKWCSPRSPRMGRRVHVIFVINVISSAVLLISCGIVGGVTAQQVQLPERQQLTSSSLLGSLQPDQEAYVFTSSFDTERDRIDQLVRQWAPLVWLAPGEKYMPSSVTDFLHHVHAEKLKTPTKKKYPTKAGDQVEEDGTGGDGDDDDIGDRDNEHELYLLHQHQQQLSEKLTSQLMRQQQLKRERLHPVSANRRTSDSQAASSGIHLNPWERRNKRTYQDENMLVDYIIDMPVGENSENWNLVTNDDLDSLLEKPSSFIYGQSPSTGPVPIYAIISPCPSGGVGELPMRPQFQPHPLPSVDQSANDIGNHVEYKHNPYIPTNMDYFTSQDALPIMQHTEPNPQQESNTENFGISEKVPNLTPVGNELGQRRKREAVQVVLAESVQNYDENLNVDDLYRKQNVTEGSYSSQGNRTDEVLTINSPSSSSPAPGAADAEEWSVLLENSSPPEQVVINQDWTPQSFHFPSPTPTPSAAVSTPPRTILYQNKNPNFDVQFIKRKIETHKQTMELKGDSYPHFHVTYWLFYPYSQGKTMCSISLGPLGRVPIPLIFGVCLGTRKDFGSHVGDWEHMSLLFRGRPEPDEMYVSAHDAGAYYEYDRLTGTFEFRDQETRVGILQKPVFPRSVLTSNKHPVLFAAKGSHGLWTAPGKHRFVRVPRLYDINGFGVPWTTWKNTEIIYTDDMQGRSLRQHWIQFQGRWGNSKTKCHPLKRIGLHFCEFSDGPKGITNRRPHFQCAKPLNVGAEGSGSPSAGYDNERGRASVKK